MADEIDPELMMDLAAIEQHVTIGNDTGAIIQFEVTARTWCRIYWALEILSNPANYSTDMFVYTVEYAVPKLLKAMEHPLHLAMHFYAVGFEEIEDQLFETVLEEFERGDEWS